MEVLMRVSIAGRSVLHGRILISFVAILFLYLPACSGTTDQQIQAGPTVFDQEAEKSRSVSLEEVRGEIDAWLQGNEAGSEEAGLLADSLLENLKNRKLSQFSPHLPVDDSCLVRDFRVREAEDGKLLASWTYVNTGDYDQNGLVNVSDLSPLGQYFGRNVIHDHGDDNPVLGNPIESFSRPAAYSQVDGNGDDLINISDITGIGRNFLAGIDGYRLYVADAGNMPTGPGHGLAPVLEMGLEEAEQPDSSSPLEFSITVPQGEPGRQYWVQPVFKGEDGPLSNSSGLQLELGEEELQLIGFAPYLVRPGELQAMEFNGNSLEDFRDRLAIEIDGLVRVPFEGILVLDNLVQCRIPLLGKGNHSVRVLLGETPIGEFEYEEYWYIPSARDVEETIATISEGNQSLSETVEFMISEMAAENPEIDGQYVEEELARLNAAMSTLAADIEQSLLEMDDEEQQVVQSMLSEARVLELFETLADGSGANSFRFPSQISAGQARSTSNLSYYFSHSATHYDHIGMLITNSQMYFDMGSLGATAAAALTGLNPVAVKTLNLIAKVKLLITFYDYSISVLTCTDIHDVRVVTASGQFDLETRRAPLVVEGLFCAEKEFVAATVQVLLGQMVSRYAIDPAFKSEDLLERLSEFVGIEALNTLLSIDQKALFDNVTPLDKPGDPCNGKLMAGWKKLDLSLYAYTDPDFLSYRFRNTAIPGFWMQARNESPWFAAGTVDNVAVRALSPDAGMKIVTNTLPCIIELDDYGVSGVEVTVFSFSAEDKGWLWDEKKLKKFQVVHYFNLVDPVVPWRFQFVQDPNFIDAETTQYEEFRNLRAVVQDGKPTVYYSTTNGANGRSIYGNVAKDAYGTEWWDRVEVHSSSGSLFRGNLHDLAMINGRACIMTEVLAGDFTSDTNIFVSKDQWGIQWPDNGTGLTGAYAGWGLGQNWMLGDAGGNFLIVSEDYSYDDLENPQLITLISLDSEGSQWDQVDIPAEPDSGLFTDPASGGIVNVAGNPAVLMLGSNTSNDIEEALYYRASTPAATSWNQPVPVPITGYYHAELVEVDGRPALLLHTGGGSNNTDIHYRIATDASGSQWSDPVELFTGTNGSNYSANRLQIAVIDGRPAAIAGKKAEQDNGFDLFFRWALDNSGTEWGPVEQCHAPPEATHDQQLQLIELEGGVPGLFQGPGFSQPHHTGIMFAHRSPEHSYPWPPPQD